MVTSFEDGRTAADFLCTGREVDFESVYTVRTVSRAGRHQGANYHENKRCTRARKINESRALSRRPGPKKEELYTIVSGPENDLALD